MYSVKVPAFFWRMFPSVTWRMSPKNRSIYLTFDDGPVPGITDYVLDTLDDFKAKATFFCIGNNVKRNPSLFKEIKKRGHAVGNHTQQHLNGWEATDEDYYDDVAECAKHVSSSLFRPPYGKITLPQINHLRSQYKIVMWEVLSGDFDQKVSNEKCLQNVVRHAREGSIIVMHDSEKAEPRLRHTLPRVLEYYTEGGYTFEAIK